MTIIAYRDGIMAADTFSFIGDRVGGRCTKLAKCEHAQIIGGAAGIHAECDRFLRSLEAGQPECFHPETDRDEFGALEVRQTDGRVIVFKIDGKGQRTSYAAPFYAMGAASDIAIGAMAAGATAEEAVRICIQWHSLCGGEVETVKL